MLGMSWAGERFTDAVGMSLDGQIGGRCNKNRMGCRTEYWVDGGTRFQKSVFGAGSRAWVRRGKIRGREERVKVSSEFQQERGGAERRARGGAWTDGGQPKSLARWKQGL